MQVNSQIHTHTHTHKYAHPSHKHRQLNAMGEERNQRWRKQSKEVFRSGDQENRFWLENQLHLDRSGRGLQGLGERETRGPPSICHLRKI